MFLTKTLVLVISSHLFLFSENSKNQKMQDLKRFEYLLFSQQTVYVSECNLKYDTNRVARGIKFRQHHA